MRADRLLSILLLLQVHGRMTARELAERLEVSERTIHRDMEALSVSGVPVTAERGAGGGWTLMEGYETKLTGLNQAEVQALFLTTPARLLQDLGLNQAAEAARIRLSAALPSPSRQAAAFVSERIHIDVSGWHGSGEDLTFLPVLQEAVLGDRKLAMVYERGDRARVDRIVDPLGLVAKGRIWYLIALADGEPRSYRVSRVRSATVLEESCVRPPDFSLAEFWAQSTSEFVTNLPKFHATVKVSPTVLGRMRYAWRYAQVERESPPDADGWVTLHVRFQTEEEAAEYVLAYHTQIEVVEPSSLGERVAALAESVVAAYRERATRVPTGGL